MRPLELPDLIETERLLLRPWAIEHAEALADALGESVEHLMPWIPWATPVAPTRTQAEALVRRWIEERTAGVNFIYAVLERREGRLVGGIGLYARVGKGRLEIGYWLRRSAAGAGLATESARALTEAGFAVTDIEALEIHIDPENSASRRIPEKLGYSLVEHRRGRDTGQERLRDTLVFLKRSC